VTGTIVDDDTQITWHEKWFTEWLEAIYEHPARLIIEIPEQLETGHQVSVVAVAQKGSSSWGLCLVREQLTQYTADQLTTALWVVKSRLRLDLDQGLAFLVHEHLFHYDLLVAAREGKKSILVEGPWKRLGISTGDAQEYLSILPRQPVWQLQALLTRWSRYGGRFPTRLQDNPGWTPEIVSYFTIPPICFEDIPNERDEQIRVSMLVERIYRPCLEAILTAKREADRAGVPFSIHVDVFGEQRQSEGIGEQSVLPQESDSSSIFKHSADFRSVSLRGEQFSFTSRQAQVVERLYNASPLRKG
jgi:hypothetical protein